MIENPMAIGRGALLGATLVCTLFLSVHAESQDLPEIKFVSIEAGSFKMGSAAGEFDEKPVHRVALSAYEISAFEITVAQFARFAEATGRELPPAPSFGRRPSDPIVNVSWEEATAFAEWLSGRTRKRHRLPTEAEWAYAARSAGLEMDHVNGKKPGGNVADMSAAEQRGSRIWNGYTDGYPFVAPVGSFSPNKLGIYDMDGNAAEWCLNWHYGYTDASVQDPRGPEQGKNRVFRGAAFVSDRWYSRIAQRNFMPPDFRADYLGFRIVREIDLPENSGK